KIYCLKVEGQAERIRITGEHPVYTLRPSTTRRGRKTWVPASQIRAGDYVVRARVPMRAVISVGAKDVDIGWVESLEGEDRLRVLAVETEDYDGFVYNFSVEEDESYTLAAGMVVHNCDFFKTNASFAHPSRKMMDEMANHGTRIRHYVEKYGEDEVETFLDKCMSIDDLIDIHSTAIKRREDVSRYDFNPKEEDDDEYRATRFKSKTYMDDYINPRKALKAEEDERRKLKEQTSKNFPERPEKDVLLFLIENAPLKGWQRDVLSIVRDEAYYFAPQAQTKIMNEGWACVHPNSLIPT